MRRCFTLCLLCLIFFNLSPNSEASVELLVWTKEINPFLNELKQMCHAFERENPGISIQLKTYSTNLMSNDLYKAATETPLNNPNFFNKPILIPKPDLLWTNSESVLTLNNLNLLEPVENLFGKNYSKKFVTAGIETLTNHNHLWGVPIYLENHLVLIYNKKLIKNPPQDTNELIKLALKQTKDFNQDGQMDQYGLVFPTTNPLWLLPWLGAYGGAPIINQKPTLNTTSMIETLRFLRDLRWNYKIVPNKCSYALAQKLFQSGKAAMTIENYQTLNNYLNNKNPNLEIAFAKLPKVTATNRYPVPYFNSVCFLYPKYLKENRTRLAAAKRLTEFFVSNNPQLYLLSAHKKTPSVTSVLKNDFIKKDPNTKNFATEVLAGTGIPNTKLMSVCKNSIKRQLTLVMEKQLDPTVAAEQMQKSVQNNLPR